MNGESPFEEVVLTDSEGEEDSNEDAINTPENVQQPKEPALVPMLPKMYISPPKKPLTPLAPFIAKRDSSEEDSLEEDEDEDELDYVQPPVAERPRQKPEKNFKDFFEKEAAHKADLEETNGFDTSSEEEEVEAFDDVAKEDPDAPKKKKKNGEKDSDDEDVVATASVNTSTSQQSKADGKQVAGTYDLWTKAKFRGLFYKSDDFKVMCKNREKALGKKVDTRTGIPKGGASIKVDRFQNLPLERLTGPAWLKAAGKIARGRPFRHPETDKIYKKIAYI